MNKEEFLKSLTELKISPTDKQLNNLESYYNLLIEENKKYNLTSITDKNLVYLKHFYDSLTITKIISITNQEICDIGTGAGFPGLVLKIMFPNIKLTLIESNSKKCNFLSLVSQTLNLKDVTIINERAETYSKYTREKYNIVTSRAVAPLKHLLEYSIPLVKVGGNYIAMKSNLTQELENINSYYHKLDIKQVKKIEFTLPIEESKRTLILYQKLSKTNPKYPRRYNEIIKKDI